MTVDDYLRTLCERDWEELNYFADRVIHGEPFAADGEHGLVDMRTFAAIYDAAERGETVSVN